jgi:hypothetical protein
MVSGLFLLTARLVRLATGEVFAETSRERSNLAALNFSLSMDTDTTGTDFVLERIRSLNDAARRHLTDGRIVFSRGLAALPEAEQADIMERVRTFEDFTPDNDPYGEHDFGVFEHNGEPLVWKIEYFDAAMEHGSEDPADPYQTTRLLTVMRAEEY